MPLGRGRPMIPEQGSVFFSLRRFGHLSHNSICPVIVLKPAAMVFTSLPFQALWPNRLNFFGHLKNSVYDRKMADKFLDWKRLAINFLASCCKSKLGLNLGRPFSYLALTAWNIALSRVAIKWWSNSKEIHQYLRFWSWKLHEKSVPQIR